MERARTSNDRVSSSLGAPSTATNRRLLEPLTDHVPGAANGVQQRTLKTFVDLGAQPRNVHVDDVGLRIEMIIPHVLQQHRSRHNLPSMLHEIFQQPKLARLQRQFFSAAGHTMRETIEFE